MSTSCQSIEEFWLIADVFLLLWIMPTCSLEHDFHLMSVQEKYPHLISCFTGQENPVFIFYILQFAQFPAELWSWAVSPQDNTDTKSFSVIFGKCYTSWWDLLYYLAISIVSILQWCWWQRPDTDCRTYFVSPDWRHFGSQTQSKVCIWPYFYHFHTSRLLLKHQLNQ